MFLIWRFCILLRIKRLKQTCPTSAASPGFLYRSSRSRRSENLFGVVFLFSLNKSEALRKKKRRWLGAAVQLRILQLNGLSPELWSLLASPHRCWAPLGLCVFHFPRPRRRPKKLHLREPRSLRAAPGLLQQSVLCIIVLISTDNIPTDPRFQSCRLKGQNFSPSSPHRLIPGFTSSALRKFNCNLGLDKILLLQKVGATW